MTIEVVGIMSPGDMGHAVGRVLIEHGLRVLTCLEGRSKRTYDLAMKDANSLIFNLGYRWIFWIYVPLIVIAFLLLIGKLIQII